VTLTAMPLAIALEAQTPLFGTTFWYAAAAVCFVSGLLMSFYGWFIPSITGLNRMRDEKDAIHRTNESLRHDNESLRRDKEELRRDKEALDRENRDLQARLRDAQSQHGAVPVPPTEVRIYLEDPQRFSARPGIDVVSLPEADDDPERRSDKGEPSGPEASP
jgi:FtsZ-binding cell division protein ZapB